MVRKALEGRYTVEREFARGGAARVFFARDTEGTPVALKILHPQLAVSVTADRFLREIAFLKELDHPHISKLVDYGESDWLVYYVMSYVPGKTLRDFLTQFRQLSIEDTLRVARELLDALGYAHENNIVHRDVKPENVVVSEQGSVLVDFGIARAIAQSGTDRLTRSGFAIGTSSYMSPEQVEGVPDIDHRSDVYSLGCVLFECLAGRPPFTAPREEAILRMHLKEKAPNVRAIRKDTPKAFAEAIAKALERQPEDRWQSARDMLAALP